MRNSIVLCAAIATIVGAAASGQTRQRPPADNDRDMAEIAAYRLTLPTLQKVIAASHAMAAALQNDPRFKDRADAQRELNALQAKKDPTDADLRRMEAVEQKLETSQSPMEGAGNDDAQSLTDMERSLAKIPHMSESLQAAGLTPREFSKFFLSAMQASFAAAFKKSGQLKELPPGVPPENVQFVIDHEADFEMLRKEMDALNGGKG